MGESPTKWIIASRGEVSVGDSVVLLDGRFGEIVGVYQFNGWPIVRLGDDFPPEPTHPMRIARKAQGNP